MILFITIMATILIALFIVLGILLDCRKDAMTKREHTGFIMGTTLLVIIICFTSYIIIRTLMEGSILW